MIVASVQQTFLEFLFSSLMSQGIKSGYLDILEGPTLTLKSTKYHHIIILLGRLSFESVTT